MVNKISSPQKQKVKQSFSKISRSFELTVCDASLAYLKSLWEKCAFPAFHKLLFDLLPNNPENDDFLKRLSKSLEIRTHWLRDGIIKYKNNEFKETRGREKCKVRQAVYDAWFENSIPSTDGRNWQKRATISKRRYLQYSDLTNQEVVIKESVNKWGQRVFSVPRMIAALTVCGIQEKLKSKRAIVSVGTLMALKPFFINYATQCEMALCLCKLCLNTRLHFDSIMSKERKSGGEIFKSVTEFFTAKCGCKLSSNGFHKWACVTGKCQQCSKVKRKFSNVALDPVITYSQFEEKETPYF